MVKYMVFTTKEFCDLCNDGIYNVSMPNEERDPNTETKSFSSVFQNSQKTLWAFLISEDDRLYIHPLGNFSMLINVFNDLHEIGVMTQQDYTIIDTINANRGKMLNLFDCLPSYTISVLKNFDEIKELGFFNNI